MKNLIHHFPTCHTYTLKKLNLERALDEDTGPGDFSFFLLTFLYWARQLFLGIPPFISDPGNLCLLDLFRVLSMLESLLIPCDLCRCYWMGNRLVPQ